mgnify:CR=1 FL=1|tara:strand:+ start:960 stop:1922 length:963 start_codon:yes stop_codon:yes gene_type:complete
MAFPNISDILATTIESRSKKIADSVTDNNGLLKTLSTKGKMKTFSGGSKILQELSFAENSNAGWYSGYDLLPVGVSDVLSAAEFDIKQAAVPVVISGLEMLQNSGKEQMIDLLDARMSVAESTLANLISAALYSDGTGNGGKEITGLDAAVPVDPTTGTYGGIDRATWTFWRSKAAAVDLTATNIQANMNSMWASLIRGSDMPDLILMDNNTWELYTASLQAQQRFHQAEVGDSGFPTLKFMATDVILDGGIGGNATANTIYFLNCKYLHYRPHAQRNMVALSPNRRYATNQDAEVQILAWAGNLTCSGAQFQGRLIDNA